VALASKCLFRNTIEIDTNLEKEGRGGCGGVGEGGKEEKGGTGVCERQ